MNYNDNLQLGLKLQGIDPNETLVCFDLYLVDDYVLSYCFLLHEDTDFLVVVTTTSTGAEEVRVVPKNKIIYAGVVYNTDDLLESSKHKGDIMYE